MLIPFMGHHLLIDIGPHLFYQVDMVLPPADSIQTDFLYSAY